MYGSQTQWGNLTLLETAYQKKMARDLAGNEYETGELGPLMMRLRCDCGHEFEIERRLFPGRRQMKNCQREECPYVRGLDKEEKQREQRRAQIDSARQKLNDHRVQLSKANAERRLHELSMMRESRLPGRPVSAQGRGQSLSVYLSLDQYEMVCQYASRKGVSASKAVGMLIQIGTHYAEAQDELEAQAALEAEPPQKPRGAKGRKLRFDRS